MRDHATLPLRPSLAPWHRWRTTGRRSPQPAPRAPDRGDRCGEATRRLSRPRTQNRHGSHQASTGHGPVADGHRPRTGDLARNRLYGQGGHRVHCGQRSVAVPDSRPKGGTVQPSAQPSIRAPVASQRRFLETFGAGTIIGGRNAPPNGAVQSFVRNSNPREARWYRTSPPPENHRAPPATAALGHSRDWAPRSQHPARMRVPALGLELGCFQVAYGVPGVP